MPGLRWVPVPLAALAALIGMLVMGTFQGQAAETNAHQQGYRAGGLALSVDTMYWMSNDMTGLGPGQKVNPNSYSMPASQMPGIQPAGDNRLRVEVALSNVTAGMQRYSTTDFSLSGPGGKTWQPNGQEHSSMVGSATLAPGFQVTVDVYFDIPGKNSKHLTLNWSRGGTTVSIPVEPTAGYPPNVIGRARRGASDRRQHVEFHDQGTIRVFQEGNTPATTDDLKPRRRRCPWHPAKGCRVAHLRFLALAYGRHTIATAGPAFRSHVWLTCEVQSSAEVPGAQVCPGVRGPG
jgi:hypothetical protein